MSRASLGRCIRIASRRQVAGARKVKKAPNSKSSLADQVARARAAGAELSAKMKALPPLTPLPTRDTLTPDHPLSQAFGLERARQLIDPEPPQFVQEAAARRAIVLEMSLAGRPVAEIAAKAGLTYGSTVDVRGRLRREGKLP